MRRVLYWISGFLPCRIIGSDGNPYLERYYLLTALGVRVYLHRFLASDPDRGYHDHPWPWAISIVLAGWYWERRRGRAHAVRWVNVLTGDTFHRVELPAPPARQADGRACVWTLFVHRAVDAKEWGFIRDVGPAGMLYTPCSFPRADRETLASTWFKQVQRGRQEPRRAPL